MKRTEMVIALAIKMYEVDPMCDYGSDGNLDIRTAIPWENIPSSDANGLLNIANKTLDALELLGMQPPSVTVMKNSYDRSTGSYGYEVNDWEENLIFGLE